MRYNNVVLISEIMETGAHTVPRLFSREYFNDSLTSSSPSYSPHLKTPVTGVRLIGGLQFEVFIRNTRRFFVLYNCFSCNRIKESLLKVSDDTDEDHATDETEGDSSRGIHQDEGIGEWIENNKELQRYWVGSHRKRSTESTGKYDTKSDTKFSLGYFKGPRSTRYPKKGHTSHLTARQKYALKYTHRDEPDSQDSRTDSNKKVNNEDGVDYSSNPSIEREENVSASSYTVTEDLKPWPSFTYVDTRLDYYSPRGSNIQIQNHDDLKQFCQESINYTSGCQEDKQKFSEVLLSDAATPGDNDADPDGSDFIHYVDPKFHLEHYKLQKNMAREKEAQSLAEKQKDSEPQHLTLPRILRELPEALRADLEFWSTYDSARKKQSGKPSDETMSFLPQIDVTKESLINLALLDQQKKGKPKQKVKETGPSIDNKKVTRKRKTRNFHSKSNFVNTALKGGTAPKHFVDNFNALRVKSTGTAPEIDRELQQELELLQGNIQYSLK